MVHGGLCPTAVRFTTTFDSTWPVPNVGDWGLASVTKAVRWPPARPVYAAPEHVDPDSFGGIDHSTDVYGLGTLLYSLLTGYTPFDGEPHVVVQQVTSTAPTAPTDRNPTLPDAVNDLLERAMAKRKPDRYETVDDLLAAFERFVDALDSVRWVE
ncbi:protein kinase domain-containing protein [Haladaptatus sp. NG-WS-4]